jgi:hypothetical protein
MIFSSIAGMPTYPPILVPLMSSKYSQGFKASSLSRQSSLRTSSMIACGMNEKADGLAKQAAGSAGNGPRAVQPHYLEQLRSACKITTKTETRERWEHQWRHEAHGRIYRKWHGTDISQQTLLMYEGLSKATNAVIIQLRTGKIRLKSYLYGIGAAEMGDCECGQDLQTVRHVVCKCPLLSSRRKALLGRATVWDIQQVLNDKKQLIQAVTLIVGSGLLGQ